jgi:predicted Kef-type K+ transport protein
MAALVFAWGTLSARLERFDVTPPITFVLAGVLLTHGPLASLGFVPSHQTVKVLAEITLVLVLFSDASRMGLRDLRADMGRCVRMRRGCPVSGIISTISPVGLSAATRGRFRYAALYSGPFPFDRHPYRMPDGGLRERCPQRDRQPVAT